MLRLEPADVTQCELVAGIIDRSFHEQVELLNIDRRQFPNFVGFETAERVQRRMGAGDHILLAYASAEPVGTVSYSVARDQDEVGHIKRLAVLPAFRGNMYGIFLMGFAESELRKRGVTRIELSIVAQFVKLQAYYERLGYVPREKKSFASLPFEVLFLEKRLTS